MIAAKPQICIIDRAGHKIPLIPFISAIFLTETFVDRDCSPTPTKQTKQTHHSLSA
jgi:hypothetical protein